ncbi:MAG: GMC family oxidoreductase [Salinisphaeraceae bacterium]|nr:GMC family oxidoreductase [Salinisphaeraceae bacterium]
MPVSDRPPTSSNHYDYIVVGAGSAGCIVAARLALNSRVLLLEAGEPADRNPETLSADGFKYAFANDDLMWHRMSAPQEACGKRRLYLGTGRGMGGSGAVNGMVYTRGDKRDFELWPKGWQWQDLEPAFTAVEETLGVQPRPSTAFARQFIEAAVESGFQHKDGLNDGDLANVVGCNDMNYAGDQRRSAYCAYIHEQKLPNLNIETRCHVERLIFDENNKAVAVEYQQHRQSRRAEIGQEVILCAGALETPKLLMLSGVGPKADLEKLGINVNVDAPGIGQNLHDHPNVCLFYRTRDKVDFQYPQVYGFNAADGQPEDAPNTCYVCYAAPASIKQSMLRMLPVLALPGRLHQIKSLRAILRGLIHAAFALPSLKRYVSGVFGIVVILGKPASRGSIRLASNNPADPAIIDPAYYACEEDRQTLVAGIKQAREIARQPALAGARPLSAGARNITGDKLWKWIHGASMTTFHFCGSCRMGNDPDSPVSPDLKVKGLNNVRVADASVIPAIPVSALNAPSMMIGYRAADFILAEQTDEQTSKRNAA